MLGSMDISGFMDVDFQVELTEEELMVQVPSVADYIFTYNYKEPKSGYLNDYYGDEPGRYRRAAGSHLFPRGAGGAGHGSGKDDRRGVRQAGI